MHLKRSLPETARIGRIRLAISDLSASLRFYTSVLGMAVKTCSDGLAELTASDSTQVLIELEEIPGIRAVAPRSRLGLYHFALLLPSSACLAGFVEHLRSLRVNFGSSDHWVSEALYLADPDGIQIEIYADRARSGWRSSEGELQLGSDPLRFDELLAIPHEAWSSMPARTVVGHLHFYVDDLPNAHRFYCEALGFDITHSSYPGVLFISAGGYHHHLGLNTWAQGASRVQSTDARLLSWELLLDDEADVVETRNRLRDAGYSALVDPWQNQLVLKTVRAIEG